MSTPDYAVTPSDFRSPVTCFTVDNATTGRVLVDTSAATTAASPLPAYSGGSTVIDLIASSTDGTARDINLYVGEVLTTQGSSATGGMAVTATTNGTITRTSGSFIAEGFKIGDNVMPFAPAGATPNANCDGVAGILTGVADLTLTVNGTPWSAVATLAAGTRIARIGKWFKAAIPANAGNDSSTPIKNVSLLGHANDVSALRYEKKLGANGILIGAMAANISTKPATVSVVAGVARY